MRRRPSALLPLAAALAAAAATVLLAGGGAGPAKAASAGLGQLHSELGAQQTRQRSLAASIGSLNGLISSLDSQIALVRGREALLATALNGDRVALASVQQRLTREQTRLARLRRRLGRAQRRLARQLVAGYETPAPDLVSVVLEARGFSTLLDQLTYLGAAEASQQTVIAITRAARAQARAAALRLAALNAREQQIADATALRVEALAGMNELLGAKQSALASARAAQQSALQASRARGAELTHQIASVEAQQAAAERAARLAADSAAAGAAGAFGPSGGPGGWAIPYAIVLCESGGQNLPPNSAGASGYYQIIPGTWKLFGGTGPAAYLASKAEQDAVAARIWRGGAGASDWVCAGIVAVH
jgi:septal ring factor EnvC (AmiA/AmiB activator)